MYKASLQTKKVKHCFLIFSVGFFAPDRNIIRVNSYEFDCTGHGDGYYENPTSCSSFYICAAGVTFKSDCHPGLLFSHASGYCDFPDHVICHSHNQVVAITTPAPVSTARPPAASGSFFITFHTHMQYIAFLQM